MPAEAPVMSASLKLFSDIIPNMLSVMMWCLQTILFLKKWPMLLK